jgi:hypothetical protein
MVQERSRRRHEGRRGDRMTTRGRLVGAALVAALMAVPVAPSASAGPRAKESVELILSTESVRVGPYSFGVEATDEGDGLAARFDRAKRHAAEVVSFAFDLPSGAFTVDDDLASGTLQTGELTTAGRRPAAAADYGAIDMTFSSAENTRTERIPCGNGAHITTEMRTGTLAGTLHFDSNTDALGTVDQTSLSATVERVTTPKGCGPPGQLGGGGACLPFTTLEATGRAGTRPLTVEAATFGALGSFLDVIVEHSGPKFDPATIQHHISVVGGSRTFTVSKSLHSATLNGNAGKPFLSGSLRFHGNTTRAPLAECRTTTVDGRLTGHLVASFDVLGDVVVRSVNGATLTRTSGR